MAVQRVALALAAAVARPGESVDTAVTYLWIEAPVFVLAVVLVAYIGWDISQLARWGGAQADYQWRIGLRAARVDEDQAWQARAETLRALTRLEVRRYEQRLDVLVAEMGEQREQARQAVLLAPVEP